MLDSSLYFQVFFCNYAFYSRQNRYLCFSKLAVFYDDSDAVLVNKTKLIFQLTPNNPLNENQFIYAKRA